MMRVEEILIIKHDDISYGIETGDVEQIMRVPELTPMALSPDEVSGLCAVGGNIATAMDINVLLGVGSVDRSSSSSRLLTLTDEFSHIAFLVSEVVDTVAVESHRIEYIDDSDDAVCAIYKNDDDIVQVLDINRMIGHVRMQNYTSKSIHDGSGKEVADQVSTEPYERYLLFRMAKERYAVNIDFLREIIALPESFTEIAGSNEEICGMMSLRDEMLIVADLRQYYGFNAQRRDENRILVLQDGSRTMGLIIDEIIDIRDFTNKQIALMPDNFQDKKLSGVIHDDVRLISLIAREVLDELLTANEKFIIGGEQTVRSEQTNRVMEVVVFRLGKEEYAIDIEEVAEIIDMTPLTPVADSPELIKGVINIRGQVIPVGSLHKRLGMKEPENDDAKIIVCQSGSERIGYVVSSVSDVMGIRSDELREAESDRELFSKILHIDGGKRLIMLFNLGILLEGESAA